MTADHRHRTRLEIERDMLAACARLGAIGLQAEIGMQPPDMDAIARTADGLHALLIEARADHAGRGAA